MFEGVDVLTDNTIFHNVAKGKAEAVSTQGYCDSHKAV